MDAAIHILHINSSISKPAIDKKWRSSLIPNYIFPWKSIQSWFKRLKNMLIYIVHHFWKNVYVISFFILDLQKLTSTNSIVAIKTLIFIDWTVRQPNFKNMEAFTNEYFLFSCIMFEIWSMYANFLLVV